MNGSGRCHGNVSHNWERKGPALRFFEGMKGEFDPIVLKRWGLMFGTEIAIRKDVREGRFLRKQAVRASGFGERSGTPLRCATRRTGSANAEPIWRPVIGRCTPLSRARVIFRGGEVARRPFCSSGRPALEGFVDNSLSRCADGKRRRSMKFVR
jgi:hypothetical protein